MVRTPYLIQRAEIKKPLAPADTRLSLAVTFDYMGAAEFEFGALPKSFCRIEAVADSWKMRLVPSITEGDAQLRVYSSFNDEEFEQYVGYLRVLRTSQRDLSVKRFYTKEAVRFEHDYGHGRFSKTDFWWDITNDVMFGFNKPFMNRVGEYVAASLKFMNDSK